jgi:hypothetical protein
MFRALFSMASVCALSASALDVPSPDGSVVFRLMPDGEGRLLYAITHNGNTRCEPARAGVLINGVDLGSGVTMGEARTRDVSETYAWRGHKTLATNDCRVAEVPVRSRAGTDWTLEARVFNGGVGWRYRVPGSGTRQINGESTAWQLPKDATVWLQTNTGDYEGEYHPRKADDVPLEMTSENRTRNVQIGPPMTVVYPDEAFAMISEAGVYRYSGMTLKPQGEGRFQAVFEDDPKGWNHEGEVLSPWRVVVLAKDLNALVNNDVIAALCEPPDSKLFPDGVNTAWIRPGKAPCTWMVFGNDGAQWDRQKWFVDVSAAMGCEYLLVDAGWRTEKWGWLKGGGNVWQRAAELCRYAAERNVGIILWHAYPEGRDDGPGLTSVEAREELFSQCQKAGVKGIKIDFFNSESRQVIDAYEDLLRRSAKYQLMINFHGANKPAGEMRTWPHEIAREGIREQEYVLWGSLPLEHYGALPFTRMAAGHADFLPGYVQTRFLKNTTAIFQLASVLVFSSPFLCWPDNPEAYLASPLLSFVRAVPVTWDETRVLPGSEIGRSVVMARRKGDEWFVSVLNCRSEERSMLVDLSSLGLGGKHLQTFADGKTGAAMEISAGQKPPEDGKFSIQLRPGGGWVLHAAPGKKFSGWR